MPKFNPKEILSQMTSEEKISLVQGASFFGTREIPRLNIPRIQFLDGGTGINFEQLFGDFCTMPVLQKIDEKLQDSSVLSHVIEHFYKEDNVLTQEEIRVKEIIEDILIERLGEEYAPSCFPTGMLLGATFDPDICYEIGQALGEEARFFGIDVLLGTPNINIHRDPLNGRLFESFSEDPCLVKTLAPALVKGVQEKGVLANVKHFAANNQETNRLGINEIISQRALEEIYLPGFRACVQEGKVKTLMSAYNAINGVPCTENKELLRKKLREEWGFDGCVISDWGAVYHPVRTLLGGTNLAMPGPLDATPLCEAYKSGDLKDEDLDRNVLSILTMIKEVLKGRGQSTLTGKQLYGLTEDVAYRAALSGCVLLKNSDFPLKNGDNLSIYIMGSGREKLLDCGRGSAGITTNRSSSLKDTLRINLTGCKIHTTEIATENMLADTFFPSADADKHVIVIATVNGMEGNDRTSLALDQEDACLLEWLKDYKKKNDFRLTLVLNVCGPIDLRAYEDAIDNLWICFLPGMQGGKALADLMCAKANPSGKLPLTFPQKYEDTPTFLNFPGDGKEICYGEGIFVGYRYYDKKQIQPAYPFGFGLSYTKFEISYAYEKNSNILSCNPDKTVSLAGLAGDMICFDLVKDKEFSVPIKIKNIGSMAGAEVIQLYLSDPFSTLTKPVKELKKLKKVFLEAGEEKEIILTLSKEDFASYDPNLREFTVEEGIYDLILAHSSKDTDEVLRIYLNCKSVYSYGPDTSIKEFYENPELKERLFSFLKENNIDSRLTDSNYQYTPQKSIKEVLCTIEAMDDACNKFYKNIDEAVKKW